MCSTEAIAAAAATISACAVPATCGLPAGWCMWSSSAGGSTARGGGDVLPPQDVYVQGAEITLRRWQGWAKAAKAKLDETMLQDAELKQAA